VNPVAPHLIAHSLGTFLMGAALKKFPDVKFRRIVLVGSILPYAYPWKEIIKGRTGCVQSVRNELGLRDWVVMLVRCVSWIARDVGTAGVSGFKLTLGLVHEVNGAWASCSLCSSGASTAQVHNVRLKEFSHSPHFLGPGHARQLWLPFLWGFAASDFNKYLELCWMACYLQQEKEWSDYDLTISELRNSVFAWTGSRTLERYVMDVVTRHLELQANADTMGSAGPSIAQIAGDIISLLPGVTFRAYEEWVKPANRDDNLARTVHPSAAVFAAFDLATK